MIDDSEIFDADDTITLYKNKITLEKYNNEKEIHNIEKTLK